MMRDVTSPRLVRFELLHPKALLAFFEKREVRYETLAFVGVCIQNRAKVHFLRTFYQGIKPALKLHGQVRNRYTGI